MWKSIVKFYKKHNDSINSYIATFLSVFALDGAAVLTNIYNGDLSSVAIHSLLMVVFRSAIKAILLLLFPTVFPKRTSKPKVITKNK